MDKATKRTGAWCDRCGGEIKLGTFYGRPFQAVEGPNAGFYYGECGCGPGRVPPEVAALCRLGKGNVAFKAMAS